MTQRATWDETWQDVAGTIRWRSLCFRARVGAVITDAHNRVVSTGYNGPPAGFNHSELSCGSWCPHGLNDDDPNCVSVHAEANAIISGDRSSWQGGTIYITKHPCMECAKLIANSGLARVVVNPDPPTPAEHRHYMVYKFLFEECGVEFELVPPTVTATVVDLPTHITDEERDRWDCWEADAGNEHDSHWYDTDLAGKPIQPRWCAGH